MKIASATDYPFNESIRMTIAAEKPVEFPLLAAARLVRLCPWWK